MATDEAQDSAPGQSFWIKKPTPYRRRSWRTVSAGVSRFHIACMFALYWPRHRSRREHMACQHSSRWIPRGITRSTVRIRGDARDDDRGGYATIAV